MRINLNELKTLIEIKIFPIYGELFISYEDDFSAQDGKTIANALMSGYFAENFALTFLECDDIIKGLSEIITALKSGKCPAGLKINIGLTNNSNLMAAMLADALMSGNCPEGFDLSISKGVDEDEMDHGIYAFASALDSGKCPDGFALDFNYTNFDDRSLTHLYNTLKSEKLPANFSLSIDLTYSDQVSPDTIDKLTTLITHIPYRQKFRNLKVGLIMSQFEADIEDNTWYRNNPSVKYTYLRNFKSAYKQLKLEINNYFATNKAFVEATIFAQSLLGENPILLEDSCLTIIKLLCPYQHDDKKIKTNFVNIFANTAVASAYEAHIFSKIQNDLAKTTTLQQRRLIINDSTEAFAGPLSLHLKNGLGSFFFALNKTCNRLLGSLKIKNGSSFFMSDSQANSYKFELKHKLMSHINQRHFSEVCLDKWVKRFYRGERTKEAGISIMNQEIWMDYLDGKVGIDVQIGIPDKLYSQFHSITGELLEESKAKSLLKELKNEYLGQDTANEKKIINSFFKLLYQEFHPNDLKRNREHALDHLDQRETKRIKLG